MARWDTRPKTRRYKAYWRPTKKDGRLHTLVIYGPHGIEATFSGRNKTTLIEAAKAAVRRYTKNVKANRPWPVDKRWWETT